MKNIAVFASGNGSNAENIIRYFHQPTTGGEVAVVVCNRPQARVVERARSLGVPVEIINKSILNDPDQFLPILEKYHVDLIVLAGFLMMIPPYLISYMEDRIINIHPSLLPKYGGKGMYGRHIHEAVVAAGERETGITIHRVSEGCDEGEVIFRTAVEVTPDDTPETVEAKIHALEQRHFAPVIEMLLK
ncbi:MAG: phosphoribosylglycinamide formyltransferase [Muribaculaceae bacterium]|nr:phosphoribosylglycinamide formyltransferase [Muribaculaceae bacterium]